MTTATLSAAPFADQERRARNRSARAETSATPVARVVIEYCPLANYRPVAQRLEAAIEEEFRGAPVETELVVARGGVYEVTINGRLVFSKRATTRLPEADEIFYHVRVALGNGPTQGPMVPPSG